MKKIIRVLLPIVAVLMVNGCSGGSDGGSITSAVHDPAFITTWETNQTGSTSDNEIKISTNNSVGHYFTIDWGDGNVDANLTGDNIHAYSEPGTYIVKVTGDFPRIYFGNTTNYDPNKLISVDNWGDIAWNTMSEAFSYCSNMQITASDAPDLSNVTDMSDMFYDAASMNANINHWDVSNVENMDALFMNAVSFNQPLDKWNTSAATDMGYMFNGATAFNQFIGSWDTSNITYMRAMFYNADAFNQPIGDWNTSKVTNMSYMFDSTATFNQPIGDWDTGKVTTMVGMFYGATAFNQPLNTWNTANVTTMNGMFDGAVAFNRPLDNWDIGKVTVLGWMFQNATAFDQDLGAWNVTSVTTAEDMFNGVTLSTANYDSLLIGWGSQVVKNGVTFSGGNSQYTASGDVGREELVVTYGWTITDGGLVIP